MVQLTAEERVLLVTTYLRTGSLETARNAFRDRFADREPRTKMIVCRNVKNIEKQGQVITETKGYLGDLKNIP